MKNPVLVGMIPMYYIDGINMMTKWDINGNNNPNWYTGWCFGAFFPVQLGIIIPTDELICFRGIG